jgi:phage terminase Nu1 subunit (DNA packaging protein)
METPSVKTADFENLRAAISYRLNNLLNSVPITMKVNVPNFEVEELQRATEGARRNGDQD